MPTTVQRGMTHTQLDTTLEKRNISEVIELLDPFETPMLNMVGRDSLHFPCDQVKHEWIEDRLIPRAGTLAAGYVAGSGQMTLSTGEGQYLYPDDTLMVGDMVFRVDAQNSDVLTVTLIRGTDAAAVSGSAWRKIAHAAPEGGNARDEDRKTVANLPYNYTQIMKDWILISGTMSVISRYGYVSERAYQEEKVLKNLALDFEQQLIYGVRSWEAGPPRRSTMGGLFEYVYLQGKASSGSTTQDWSNHIVNAGAGDLTETMLNNLLQTLWEGGAQPDFMMVNGTNKRRVTSWIRPYQRLERAERTAGASVGTYESDFGTIDIVLNRHLRASDVLIGTKGQLGIGPLNGRAFSSGMLPAAGDYQWYEILGEYTMEVHKPSVDFGWIWNTSTTY